MTTKDQDGPVLPLLIYEDTGTIAWMGIINTKGGQKSLEQGEPWILDGQTGRLLPLADRIPGLKSIKPCIKSIRTGNDRVEIDLVPGLRLNVSNGPQSSSGTIVTGVRKVESSQAGIDSVSGSEVPVLPADTHWGFLEDLENLVRERKAHKPEGSYTTHLFDKGLSKIRKKTGEEAIELLLAENPTEVVSEAADLMYHLIVLLVALDIPFGRVIEELKKR